MGQKCSKNHVRTETLVDQEAIPRNNENRSISIRKSTLNDIDQEFNHAFKKTTKMNSSYNLSCNNESLHKNNNHSMNFGGNSDV